MCSTRILKYLHLFRLPWGLPKIIFLTTRYVVPPMLLFVTQYYHSHLTDNFRRDSFTGLSEWSTPLSFNG